MSETNLRHDGRRPDQLRPVNITLHFTKYAEGSAFIQMGDTWVICNASVEDRVPPFLRGTGQGWITAEYAMLPRSTETRSYRESWRLNQPGRSQEIQRLIGRSLRAAVDLTQLGERTITIDCDVIQADGGTRTASITGGFVALVLALRKLKEQGLISHIPVKNYLAAISVGIVDGQLLLDLDYSEDSRAEVDMNVVCLGDERFVEAQATAEVTPFTLEQLTHLLRLAQAGIRELIAYERRVLGELSSAETVSVQETTMSQSS